MQNTYAQNKEDIFVLNYFGDFKGTLLEIGANDGMTFSNSRLLIELGWEAHLVEPANNVFGDLQKLYWRNRDVYCYHGGIGIITDVVSFWESENHITDGTDKSLVSTTVFEETKRWPNVKFVKTDIQLYSFDYFMKRLFFGSNQFDFISIDAEGMDWQILQQIDLDAVGCKCLCIEWNGDYQLKFLFTKHCEKYGMKEALINGENIIFVK